MGSIFSVFLVFDFVFALVLGLVFLVSLLSILVNKSWMGIHLPDHYKKHLT